MCQYFWFCRKRTTVEKPQEKNSIRACVILPTTTVQSPNVVQMLIKIPGDKWKRFKLNHSFQQNQYNYIKMYIFNGYGYKLAKTSLSKSKTECFLWCQLAACFCIHLTKHSASCELWYPDELSHPLHPAARAEWLPLTLPEAGLSPGIRMHCRLAETWMGSKGSPVSHEQLTLKWRLAWSVQSKAQFPILGKIKWLFSVYTAEKKNTFSDSSFSFHSREKVWKADIFFSLAIKTNI